MLIGRNTILVAFMLGSPVTGCTGGTMADGGLGKVAGGDGSGEKDEPSDKPDNGSDAGDDEASDQPAEVAGAFLTCGHAADAEVKAGATAIGCGVYNQENQKLPGEALGAKVSGVLVDGTRQQFESQITPESSPYHLLYWLPDAVKGQVTSMDVSFTIGTEKFTYPNAQVFNEEVPGFAPDPATGVEDSDAGDGTGALPFPRPVVPPSRSTHTMFVTSIKFRVGSALASSGFSSIEEADAQCVDLAKKAGRPESDFKAVLSTSQVDARNRFAISGDVNDTSGRRISVPGIFWSNSHENAIEFNESGERITGAIYVWTGTTSEGLRAKDHCKDWSSNLGLVSGVQGLANDTKRWLEDRSTKCDGVLQNEDAHLYCLSSIYAGSDESEPATELNPAVGGGQGI